VARP